MYCTCKLLVFLNSALKVMLLVSLYGCSQSNPQTVVTLHHIEASSLQEALTKSLGPDIKFSVTENKIVIFEAVANITPTLELLKSLDESPSIVKLHFRRLKQYGYSTIENPEPFSIKENQETEIVVNNEKLHVIFKRASMNTFIFKMMTKKNRRVNKIVFEIKEGQWEKIHLVGLESFPMLKIERQY